MLLQAFLPLHATPQSRAAHQAFMRDVCARFGGYTVTSGLGGWQHEGVHEQERVAVYQVVVARGSDEATAERVFGELVQKAGRTLGQKAVLWGTVPFVGREVWLHTADNGASRPDNIPDTKEVV